MMYATKALMREYQEYQDGLSLHQAPQLNHTIIAAGREHGRGPLGQRRAVDGTLMREKFV